MRFRERSAPSVPTHRVRLAIRPVGRGENRGHDVPPCFQRMAAIPRVLQLHRARGDGDVETIDGVRVTTALRTLVDVIADDALSRELQVQAVDEA